MPQPAHHTAFRCPTGRAAPRAPAAALIASTLAVLLAYTLAGGLPLAAQPPAGDAVRSCTEAIVRRELLRDERGQLLQFTRNGIAARDGEILLSGAKSATFAMSANGQADLSSQDSIIAVLRRRDGTTQAFAAPALPAAAVEYALPVPLLNGEWGVFIRSASLDSSGRRSRNSTTAIWLLRLGADGSSSLEALPLPAGVTTVISTDPSVAARQDRVVIAFPASDTLDESGVLMLEQRPAGWSSRWLSLPGTAYVAVAFDGARNDLSLAVVRPDRSRMTDANSLFVIFPERAANVSHLVAVGGNDRVHQPRIVTTPTGVLLAWHRRDPSGASFKPRQTEVAAVRRGTPAAPASVGAPALQVALGGDSAHAPLLLLARSAGDGTSELELFAPPSGKARVTLRIPSVSPIATDAVLIGDELLVTQPVVLGGGTHLANELLWVSARCDAAGGL